MSVREREVIITLSYNCYTPLVCIHYASLKSDRLCRFNYEQREYSVLYVYIIIMFLLFLIR